VRALWFAPATLDGRDDTAPDAGVIVTCVAATLLVVALGVMMSVPGLP
jgi:hypothetical protein